MDIISIASSYFDGRVTVMVLFLTEIIKRLIPKTSDGSLIFPLNKLFPFIPVGLGILFMFMFGKWLISLGSLEMPVQDIIIKGFMSGVVATYWFKTAKIIFVE